MSSSKYEQMGGMVHHDNGFYRLGGGVGSTSNDHHQHQMYQEQLNNNNNHHQYQQEQQQQQFYNNNNSNVGVDHYMMSGGYYPDSDLETIAEESSVIESEVSTRHSGKVMTMSDGNESDSTLSEFSSIEHSRRSSKEELRSSITSSDASSTGRNIPRSYQLNNKQQQRVTPLAEQKIVFAKCLPGHRESRDHVNNQSVSNDPPPVDMFDAAKAGHFHALSRFSADELSSTLDEKGNTLMHVAAENGQLDCVQRLVSIFNPSMVLLPNDDILTATGLAIKNGHTKCTQWMLENTPAKEELIMSRLASNIDGFNTRDPVAHIAARFDREELLDWICEEMVRDDISVDTANHTSDAAIHIAARYGNIKCVQALVARGASVTILNSLGETPAQAAQKAGHSVCVGYLVVVETCVSLAQQVVSLKNDLESLQNRHDNVMARNSKSLDSHAATNGNGQLGGKVEINLPVNGETKPTTTAVMRATNEQPLARRTLQQQPPPPKIWLSGDKNNSAVSPTSTQQENNKNHRLNNKNNHQQQQQQQQATTKTSVASRVVKPPPVQPERQEQKEVEEQNNKELDDSAEEIADLTKGLTTAKKPWENLTIDEILKMVREIRYQPSPSVSHFTEDSQMESVEVMKDRLAAASRWFLVDGGKGKFSNGLNNNVNNRRRRQPDSHYQVFTPNMAPKKQQQQHPKQQQHGMTNLDKQQQQMQKQQTQQQQPRSEHRQRPLQTNGTSNNNNSKPHTKSQVLNPPLTNKTNNTQRGNSNGKPPTTNQQRTKSPERNSTKKASSASSENFQTHQHALLVTKSTSSNHTSPTNANLTTQHKRAMFERTTEPSTLSAAVKFGSDKRKSSENFTNETTQVYKKGSLKENGLDDPTKQQSYGKPRNVPNSARQLNASTQRSGSYRRAVWSAPYLRSEPSSAEQRLNQKNLAAENHRFHHQQQQQQNTSPLANDELRERLSPPSEVEEKGKVVGGGGGKSVGMWTKPGVNNGVNPNHNSAAVPASNNKTVITTDNSNQQQRGKTKGYNWVNSYFRNRSSSASSAVQQPPGQQQQLQQTNPADEDVAPEPSEVPELRNEMAPRQSSFLRKVQGKRKQQKM